MVQVRFSGWQIVQNVLPKSSPQVTKWTYERFHTHNITPVLEFSDSTARVLDPETTQLAKGWHNLPAKCLDYVMTFDNFFISFRFTEVDPMIKWWKRTRSFNFYVFRYWRVLNIRSFNSQNRLNSVLKRRQIWWPNIVKLLAMQHQVSGIYLVRCQWL